MCLLGELMLYCFTNQQPLAVASPRAVARNSGAHTQSAWGFETEMKGKVLSCTEWEMGVVMENGCVRACVLVTN